MFMIQAAAMSAGLLLAWLLQYNFATERIGLLLILAPVLVMIRWSAMSWFGIAHSHWRYTGMGDIADLLRSLGTGTIVFFVVSRIIFGSAFLPFSIYVLEVALTFLFLASLRINALLILRTIHTRRYGARTQVLIAGAGSAAIELLQVLKNTGFQAVGLLDDDPWKRSLKLNGVPVLGTIDELPALAKRTAATEVLIAIPTATVSQMIRITEACTKAGLPFRTVPALSDLIDGTATISELRKVNVDDLLGRKPVRLESEDVRATLTGRVVMVTGAAGSVGSELCRQIVRYQPYKLICVDQAETPLFNLQQHTLDSAGIEVIYSVADITDSERMRELFLEHDVRVVFHAAAYKHVPMMEANPYEGLRNNVFGLLDFVETAEECGCEDFLLISTDKAVNPSSIMGCTKRLGEMIVGSRETAHMRCVSVRFGNVLGSQGSVIPLFLEQIHKRKCITVTHPQMTRYFMTIPEAVCLVLKAFAVGEHGDVLVLDMGEPVRILDLAKTLIHVSGKREDEVRIVFTGVRPGEKLHEELLYESEQRLPTTIPEVMRAQGNLPAWPELSRRLAELQQLPCSRNEQLMRAKIKQIIPEYQWVPDQESRSAEAVASLNPIHQLSAEPRSV
jgi:FlaA1/EpsC-like NDP-sugar epimerase